MGSSSSFVKMPVYGAGAVLNDGTLLMRGVTAETDLGTVIAATSAIADTVGFLKGDHPVASDAVVAGTTWVYSEVELPSHVQLLHLEYDQVDDMDVASTSGTTVTITSLEDNIDTGWLYAVSGTGSGLLAYIATSASGSCVTKTATGWDSTTDVIKILPICHKLAKLTAASTTVETRLGTDAAAGSAPVFVYETWFQANGYPKQLLNPTLHDNLTLTGARFWARLAITASAGN